jgi:hypothetical protein
MNLGSNMKNYLSCTETDMGADTDIISKQEKKNQKRPDTIQQGSDKYTCKKNHETKISNHHSSIRSQKESYHCRSSLLLYIIILIFL